MATAHGGRAQHGGGARVGSGSARFDASALPGWGDAERVSYLFNDFQHGTVDEDVVTWWVAAATAVCRHGGHVTFTPQTLKDALSGDLQPLGVPLLMGHALASGKVATFASVLTDDPSLSWWLFDVAVVKPTSMIWGAMMGTSAAVKAAPATEELVVPQLLEEAANALFTAATKVAGTATLLLEPARSCAPDREPKLPLSVVGVCGREPRLARLTAREREAVVKLLVRQKRATLVDCPGQGRAVVVGHATSSLSPTTAARVHSLYVHITYMESRVRALEQQAARVQVAAVRLFKAGDKRGAKQHLRRRNVYRDAAAKMRGGLENLERTHDRIQRMHDDAMMMEAYKAGLAAMNEAKAELGLDLDEVNRLMDDVAEVTDELEAVSSALGEPVSGATDDDALMAELDALEGAEAKTAAPATAVAPAAPVSAALPSAPPSAVGAGAGGGAGAGAGVAARGSTSAMHAESNAQLDDIMSRLTAMNVADAPEAPTHALPAATPAKVTRKLVHADD